MLYYGLAHGFAGLYQIGRRISQSRTNWQRGVVLRKFALLTSACTIFLLASFASAQQQVDILVGGSTLKSLALPSQSVNFHPLEETGGTFISIGGDYVGFRKSRFGLSAETAWRYRQASYYGYETYRPILTDVNAFFQPKLSKKLGLDFMAGIGVASNRFTLLSPCGIPGCTNFTGSNHFMEDLGGGFRYQFWHRLPHVFVRPEVHYYHIQNNVEFNSNNVFRLGFSLGYIIAPD